MSTTSCSEESSISSGGGQPKPYGMVHPTLQQVDCPVHDLTSLRQHLQDEDPLCNWQTDNDTTSDPSDLSSWFPSDDQIAFYTPAKENQLRYHALTYQELQEQLNSCPPFSIQERVAIVIPTQQMADMAMTLLSVIQQGAIAVPLDPRMPAPRILEAMQQLGCTSLVATKDVLLDGSFLVASNGDSSEVCYTTNPSLLKEADSLNSYFCHQVHAIRLVSSTGCALLEWTCLSKHTSADGSWIQATPNSSNEMPIEYTRASTLSGTTDANSLALLLRTSGTTSKPKVVPISRHMLLYGAVGIATALQLQRHDCNANSMPFYHIGGISCNLLAVLVSGGSVLFAGPLQDPNLFLDHLTMAGRKGNDAIDAEVPVPTWYYAGPSMHKAIALMAEARFRANGNKALSTKVRFIRNAAAHLNHDLALRLSTLFACQVIPTYGMSEAMPICSSAPIDVRCYPPCAVIDSVGYPAGTSVRIVNPDTGAVLKHGEDQIGEICVKGAGVISHYIGIDVNKSHTDGWLATGDHGVLDRQGRLFIKGRSKEMIKRGGEQVWPNEIDDVVEKVSEVATAVAFGVPNELWGEEVAVAVVLKDAGQLDNDEFLLRLRVKIIETCRNKLDELSLPQQVIFLASTDDLLRGSTGKYIRCKMASHLNVKAVDTGALKVLESVSQQQHGGSAHPSQNKTLAKRNHQEINKNERRWDWLWPLLETRCEEGYRVDPSAALNGVRFLVSCFVVQVHVGLFPNLTWIKLQGYIPNMMIFFGIGGFQTTSQVVQSVKGNWANFVGTKIGALHSLFVISQLITFPSYVLFRAFDEEGNLVWETSDWILTGLRFIASTITGMGHRWDVNMFSWFQSTYYLFLALFPFLDATLRQMTLKLQIILLVASGVLAASLWGSLYLAVPYDIFWGPLYPFGWSIVTWLPLLIASMLAAYMFRRLAIYYSRQEVQASLRNGDEEAADGEVVCTVSAQEAIDVHRLLNHTRLWGIVCDITSIFLLAVWIGVALAPNCICVYSDTFESMRPNEELPPLGQCPQKKSQVDYVYACDITYNEFTGYIQGDENNVEFGRFVSNWAGAMGYLRCASPIYLLWISAMAFGNGYTSRLFESKIFAKLAPLGYPLYLVHMAVVRYYWVATRGLEKQFWFGREGEYPFPVEWWEFFLLLFLSTLVGALVNTFLVPKLMPYTISFGVKVCSLLSQFGVCLLKCAGKDPCTDDEEGDLGTFTNDKNESPTYKQVRSMVRGLTGLEVARDAPLRNLGLDSLGAAALLGALRSSIPSAQTLTLRDLQDCDTVGSLVAFLDRCSESTILEIPTVSFQNSSRSSSDGGASRN